MTYRLATLNHRLGIPEKRGLSWRERLLRKFRASLLVMNKRKISLINAQYAQLMDWCCALGSILTLSVSISEF